MRIVIQYYVGIVSYKEDIMISPIVMIVENFQFIKTNNFILQTIFAPEMTGSLHPFIINKIEGRVKRSILFYYIMKQYKDPQHVRHY